MLFRRQARNKNTAQVIWINTKCLLIAKLKEVKIGQDQDGYIIEVDISYKTLKVKRSGEVNDQ